VQGAPDAVARVVMWCHEGPPRAQVSRVEVRDELPIEAETGSTFSIR
jgi:acylphosphatase